MSYKLNVWLHPLRARHASFLWRRAQQEGAWRRLRELNARRVPSEAELKQARMMQAIWWDQAEMTRQYLALAKAQQEPNRGYTASGYSLFGPLGLSRLLG